MLTNAGTDVVVTDAHKSDGLRGIIWQTVETHLLRQLVACHKLKHYRQIGLNQFVHPPFDFLLLLARWLRVQIEAHLTFLSFDMGIIRPFTAEEPYHRLIQQMLRRMCGRELFFIMVV